MRVLGIDPGTATTGIGLVDYEQGREKLVYYGTIRTVPNLAMHLRLLQIHQELDDIIRQYEPEAVAIEELFHQKNAKTVITVAQARGVLLMTAAARNIEISEYTPLQVKQAVCGYGNAVKKQVQLMVKQILHMENIAKPDDAADALAIAICHLHSYRMGNLYKGRSSL